MNNRPSVVELANLDAYDTPQATSEFMLSTILVQKYHGSTI